MAKRHNELFSLVFVDAPLYSYTIVPLHLLTYSLLYFCNLVLINYCNILFLYSWTIVLFLLLYCFNLLTFYPCTLEPLYSHTHVIACSFSICRYHLLSSRVIFGHSERSCSCVLFYEQHKKLIILKIVYLNVNLVMSSLQAMAKLRVLEMLGLLESKNISFSMGRQMLAIVRNI